jgi:hypothetical protein
MFDWVYWRYVLKDVCRILIVYPCRFNWVEMQVWRGNKMREIVWKQLLTRIWLLCPWSYSETCCRKVILFMEFLQDGRLILASFWQSLLVYNTSRCKSLRGLEETVKPRNNTGVLSMYSWFMWYLIIPCLSGVHVRDVKSFLMYFPA